MKKLTTLFIFTVAYTVSFGQYYDDGAGDSGIRSHITSPLAGYVPLFYKFSMAVIAIVAIVITAKIYVRWQEGDDSVFESITRWYFGLIVIAALLYFLKVYFEDYQLKFKPDLNF